LNFFDCEVEDAMPWGGKRVAGPGKYLGRPPSARLTAEEFDAMVQEQGDACALCSEPGSAGGLVVDVDLLRKRIRGLLHPQCKTFLALGRDNPLRFQLAIRYLERRAPTLSAPAIKA
jgi:hypothetical protein